MVSSYGHFKLERRNYSYVEPYFFVNLRFFITLVRFRGPEHLSYERSRRELSNGGKMTSLGANGDKLRPFEGWTVTNYSLFLNSIPSYS